MAESHVVPAVAGKRAPASSLGQSSGSEASLAPIWVMPMPPFACLLRDWRRRLFPARVSGHPMAGSNKENCPAARPTSSGP